jgi:hypothetical protein
MPGRVVALRTLTVAVGFALGARCAGATRSTSPAQNPPTDLQQRAQTLTELCRELRPEFTDEMCTEFADHVLEPERRAADALETALREVEQQFSIPPPRSGGERTWRLVRD